MSDGSVPQFRPMRFALDRLFAEDAPYSAVEIAVVLAIVKHINKVSLDAWPSYPRLARQTRLSTKTIERVLRRHCEESPAPLLCRRFVGHHKTYTFQLVRDPEVFARNRDALPKRPRRTRRKPAPKQTAPLMGAPRIVPKRPRKGFPAARRVNGHQCGKCRCGAYIVEKGGIVTNYIDDQPHVCRFTESVDQTESLSSDKTESLTNTSTPIEPIETVAAAVEIEEVRQIVAGR